MQYRPSNANIIINTTAYTVSVGQCILSLETMGVDTARWSTPRTLLGPVVDQPRQSIQTLRFRGTGVRRNRAMFAWKESRYYR